MDFDKLLEVIKASHIATLTSQMTIMEQLAKNTNTSYDDAISDVQSQITKINDL